MLAFIPLGEMPRQKIEIKKIDNRTARQLAFSKRRKVLFKKAQELSTFCDAEIALMVSSATGKLSDMKQVIERRYLYSDIDRLDRSSIELQIESDTYNMLHKEKAYKAYELRQLKGKELQGLSTKELQKLEGLLETGLSRVTKAKVCTLPSSILHAYLYLGLKKMEGKEESKMFDLEISTLLRNLL